MLLLADWSWGACVPWETEAKAGAAQKRTDIAPYQKGTVVSANSRDAHRTPGSTWGRGESLWGAWLCGGMKEAGQWGSHVKKDSCSPKRAQKENNCHSRVFDSFDKETPMISQKLGAVPLCFKEPQKFLRCWGRERESPVDRLNVLQRGGIKPQRSILHTPFVIQESSPLPVPIPSTGASASAAQSPRPGAPDTGFSSAWILCSRGFSASVLLSISAKCIHSQ